MQNYKTDFIQLFTGELSGVIVASVLGAIALLMLLSVCFFRT